MVAIVPARPAYWPLQRYADADQAGSVIAPTCAACQRRFRSDMALSDHMRDKHGANAPAERQEVPVCIECGSLTKLVGGKHIYPHRPDLYEKRFWKCACGAYCGCHGITTRPLGYPCGPITRRARSAAHAVFDNLWKSHAMDRREAYAWLADRLEIDPIQCHIGMMDATTAKRVVEAVMTRVKATV